MAVSAIKKDPSVMSITVTIIENVIFYRRGNVCMIFCNNINITDTTNPTLIGTVPSGCEPPTRVYSRDVSANALGYLRVDSDGKIYAYRTVAGKVLDSIVWGAI